MSLLDAFAQLGYASTLFPGPIEFAGVAIPRSKAHSEWIRFANGLVRTEDIQGVREMS